MSEESGFQVGRDAPAFYETHVGQFMAPFVEALITATVHPGNTVLDVACGTGFATRAAANAAGPGARVEGVDINPAMLAQARASSNVPGATLGWWEASGLNLPFENSEFDAVICQQGLQFFPDPVAGVREMKRVARPGGRVGATVWSAPERSPFLHRREAMIAGQMGEAPPDYSTTETQLREWFTAGGLSDVNIELIEVDVDLPPVFDYVPESLKALPWSAGFLALTDDQRHAAMTELDAALSGYRTSTGIRVPFSSYLATAPCPLAQRWAESGAPMRRMNKSIGQKCENAD